MEKIELSLKGIRADEMSFKLNGMRPQSGGKVELKPSFARRVRRAAENEKLFFVTLSVKIESTQESPKPFDLSAVVTGLFEANAQTEEERRSAVVEATSVLYPYLRSAVTSLTAAAFAAPIVLPIVSGPMFPEDKEKEGGFVS